MVILLASTSDLGSPLVRRYIADLIFKVTLGNIHTANFFKKEPSYLLHVSKIFTGKVTFLLLSSFDTT